MLTGKEIHDRGIKFLKEFKILRKESKALKASNLNKTQLERLITIETDFAQKFETIREHIKNTIACSICKKVWKRVEFDGRTDRKNACFSTCRECTHVYYAKVTRKYVCTLKGRLHRIYGRVCDRARKDNTETDITREYLLELYNKQEGKCFYTGKDMIYDTEETYSRDLVSIDRVNPNKSYTKDNVVLCCWGVNNSKRDYTLEEYVELCGIVYNRFKV